MTENPTAAGLSEAEREAAVWVSPGRLGGEPCLYGTRLQTALIAANRDHATDWWDVTAAQVEVACWYEDGLAAEVAAHVTAAEDRMREAVARAWDEGEQAGRDNADDGYPDPMVENPYRAALAPTAHDAEV